MWLCAIPRAAISEPHARSSMVEANEPLDVEVAREAVIVEQTLPENARARVVPRLLERDRRVPDPARLLEEPRRERVVLLVRRDARAIERNRARALGFTDVAEIELRCRQRTTTPEPSEALPEEPHVQAELVVDDGRAIDQQPEMRQRFVEAAPLDRALRFSLEISCVDRSAHRVPGTAPG